MIGRRFLGNLVISRVAAAWSFRIFDVVGTVRRLQGEQEATSAIARSCASDPSRSIRIVADLVRRDC